ncbi:MAG: methylmalonyl Co-A mutase-associated GTPase MeaB [Bacteroidota bacterium]
MARKRRPTRTELREGILQGDRIVLSKAITIIESQHPEDQALGASLLDDLLPHTGGSIRIGVTGVPGVGKSTFIEAFGMFLSQHGKKVAVLSIDPSSTISSGSILGDKSRMTELAQARNAYIRPSPTGMSLGGVAHATRETILLCEAAGYDTTIVETVGVGQSETMVKEMVDFFLLLMLAGGGDELQGIKRGIMEMADALVINKADGQNVDPAKHAAEAYRGALHLFPPKESGWTVPVSTCSSLEGRDIETIWQSILEYVDTTQGNGYFSLNRNEQVLSWFKDAARQRIIDELLGDRTIHQSLGQLEQRVADRQLSVRGALSMITKEAWLQH